MADAVPGWTDRPAEWAVLRDQIAATSKPTLSDSIRLSFYILMVLCSSSIGFHLLAVCLRLRRNTCLRNRFFGCTSLGHHQPDLTLILPILLVINALRQSLLSHFQPLSVIPSMLYNIIPRC
jgi:hypothetical protein